MIRDFGLNDEQVDQAIEAALGDFRLDDVPDDQQPLAVAFYEFAHQLVDMVPNCHYVIAGVSCLAQARGYFVAAKSLEGQGSETAIQNIRRQPA